MRAERRGEVGEGGGKHNLICTKRRGPDIDAHDSQRHPLLHSGRADHARDLLGRNGRWGLVQRRPCVCFTGGAEVRRLLVSHPEGHVYFLARRKEKVALERGRGGAKIRAGAFQTRELPVVRELLTVRDHLDARAWADRYADDPLLPEGVPAGGRSFQCAAQVSTLSRGFMPGDGRGKVVSVRGVVKITVRTSAHMGSVNYSNSRGRGGGVAPKGLGEEAGLSKRRGEVDRCLQALLEKRCDALRLVGLPHKPRRDYGQGTLVDALGCTLAQVPHLQEGGGWFLVPGRFCGPGTEDVAAGFVRVVNPRLRLHSLTYASATRNSRPQLNPLQPSPPKP